MTQLLYVTSQRHLNPQICQNLSMRSIFLLYCPPTPVRPRSTAPSTCPEHTKHITLSFALPFSVSLSRCQCDQFSWLPSFGVARLNTRTQDMLRSALSFSTAAAAEAAAAGVRTTHSAVKMSAGDVVCTGWLIKSPPEKKLKRFVSRSTHRTLVYVLC